MTNDLVGSSPLTVLSGELVSLTQGTDKLVLPCLWPETQNVVITGLGIFMLTTPAVAVHSFSFLKNGSVVGAVAVTASGNFWTSVPTPFSLKGMTDTISVRHDTTAQNANESGEHRHEGVRIFAALFTSVT